MPHINEKIDFTAEVFVVFQNKVLLRKHDKYGIWLSVGGHVELDEDPNQAALREVKEEVGIDVELVGSKKDFRFENYQELIPPNFVNRHRISDTHEHVTMTYFAGSQTNEICPSKTEKSEECRWFTAEELQDPSFGIKQHVQYYALAALAAVRKKLP
jgi:8-oxo-dGTP pyrophosphatase MutT (NUDIX family)